VVHGHSSHHPLGIEVHRGRPILYGCGDFLNDYEGIAGQEGYRGDLGLMYFLDMAPARGTLRDLWMIPLQIRRMRLIHASASDRAWLQATLDRESRKFGGRVGLAADGKLVLRWEG
jgi:poly-gamma-glutamate synthesis protein (capsule biosynthesis protein)